MRDSKLEAKNLNRGRLFQTWLGLVNSQVSGQRFLVKIYSNFKLMDAERTMYKL